MKKILVFGQPSPSDKLKSIKFEDTLCGILTKSPVETTYFLVKKTGATWKIIKFFGWDFFGITDDHPNTILSITLDSARQITVIKTDNTVEITSLDAKGKVIVTTKKE